MALSFFKKKDCIALDIGSNSIKIVALKQSKKGWELQKMGIAYRLRTGEMIYVPENITESE